MCVFVRLLPLQCVVLCGRVCDCTDTEINGTTLPPVLSMSRQQRLVRSSCFRDGLQWSAVTDIHSLDSNLPSQRNWICPLSSVDCMIETEKACVEMLQGHHVFTNDT